MVYPLPFQRTVSASSLSGVIVPRLLRDLSDHVARTVRDFQTRVRWQTVGRDRSSIVSGMDVDMNWLFTSPVDNRWFVTVHRGFLRFTDSVVCYKDRWGNWPVIERLQYNRSMNHALKIASCDTLTISSLLRHAIYFENAGSI